MHLLDVLGSDADGFRLADLAVHASLPPSTVHRLLTTMEQRGFVQFEKGSATWHIGGRLFAIGATFARRRNFVAAAMPILRGLRDGTRETANLGVDENGEVVLMAQVESREIIRVISPVGGRAPMTSDALGKAILSTYAEDEVARITGLHGMHRRTDTTITRAGEMFEALRAIRAVGYAVDLGEPLSEVRCVAAPVLDAAGSAIAAISVSGLASRIPDARIADLGATVRDAARKLSAPMLSRVLTALNRLPSTATTPPAIRPTCRHRTTNCLHAVRTASPLSRRKSAMVLKSGVSLPVSYMSSTLRPASRSKRRLDCTWFM